MCSGGLPRPDPYVGPFRISGSDCKALAMPLVKVILEDMAQDLEDEGRLGDAEDCHELLNGLARETGLDRRLDQGPPMRGPFAFQAVSPLSVNR